MLTGIDPRMTPELLSALTLMGHGEEIVIADANYPAASTAAHCDDHPLPLPGLDAPEAVRLITSLMPIDSFGAHGNRRRPGGDGRGPFRGLGDPRRSQAPEAGLGSIERREFCIRARKAFAVVHTSEARPFGCFILRKGVVF